MNTHAQLAQANRKAKALTLWHFLNSNFGLFLLSTFFLSFSSWIYTQWTQGLEQDRVRTQSIRKLETEINYRTRLMDNFFASECADNTNIGSHTIESLKKMYNANSRSSFKGVFTENNDKPLHTLIWEWASLQHGQTKHQGFNSFEVLLAFNAYVNRLTGSSVRQGSFYGEPIDYHKEVKTLRNKLNNGLRLVRMEPGQTKLASNNSTSPQ